MALRRHNGRQVSGSIWPGFVDAMTALMMILMFVLTIFMVVQFVLRETITGKDVELKKKTIELAQQSVELDTLSAQIAGLAKALGLEQVRSKGLTGELASTQDSLQSAQDQITQQTALISSLTSETEAQKNKIASFEQQVAGLLAERSDLSGRLKQTEATLAATEAEKAKTLSQKQAVQLALAQARSEIDQKTEQARLAAAKREALDALIADLKTQSAAKDTQIASIETQLSEKEKQRLTQAAALLVLQQNLKAKQTDLEKLQAAAALKDTKIASIKSQLSEKEKQRLTQAAALLALQQNLKLKQSDLERLQAAAAAKDMKIASIETQLSEKEKQRLKEAAEVLALQERLKSKVDALSKLQTEVAARDTDLKESRQALSDAEKLRLVEMAATKALREKLKTSNDALTAMTLALDAKRKQAENTLTLLAAANAAKTAAVKLADQHLSEEQKQAVLLAEANKLLKNEKALSTESQRKLALLNQQTSALRGQLNALQGLLDDAKAKDSTAQIQIKSLGSNLNRALARVAAEQKRRAKLEEEKRIRLEAEAKDLKKYRSEFFGRLRDVLGAQKGVRIVGDRFVFSSEVLFTAGSAELGDGGKAQIRQVADIIKQVADKIPPQIDWILRVDGHTDNVPLSGNGLYHDNWELSQARALSVVKYMIDDLGFAANRLAAAGFGEFQPIAKGDSPEALAQNRRIELKFTEK